MKGDFPMPDTTPTTKFKVFTDFHPNIESSEDDYANYVELDEDNDNGGMHPEIASNMSGIRSATIAQAPKVDTGIYDFSTKNKSFIQLHKDLKKLGIKNNRFFLKLYDTTLKKVDPFAIVVPLEIQARIIRECIRNPWYFLREIARIPVDGKPICPGGGSPFIIDRNSVATWYLFLNGFDTYASKPRQCGKTMDALQKINYAYSFGAMSGTITMANKDLTLNKMNLARLKAQRDMLPLYLQMKNVFDHETQKILKETSNVTSMKNPITKNTITLLPTASTEAKAEGLGRGYTSSIQFWDEFDWTPWNTKIIDTSVFAFNSASDNAKKNKSLYGRIFTSTPGNLDSRDGRNAESFINGNEEERTKGMLKWTDSMLDVDINKLYQIVHSRSYNGIIFVEHSWKQLKKSYEWYERACEGVRFNPEQIAREIQLKRLRGTSRSPFKRQDIMTLISHMMEAKESVDFSDNLCSIKIYDKINRKIPYVISIDPAEGLSGDNMAMVVINPYTEKPVAEFESPYIRQDKMSDMVVKFMDKYCPRSMIVVENNRGRELIHRLQETYYCTNLWFDVDKIGSKETINSKEPDTSAEKALGFTTSRTTRPLLYNILESMVAEEQEKLCTKLLVDSICSLEKSNTGRIAAASGKHDDMCMAYLFGIYVLRNSTNIEEWGIVRGGKEPTDESAPTTQEEALQKLREFAELLPDDIRKLLIKEEKNPVKDAFEYERQLQSMNSINELTEYDRRSVYDNDVDLEIGHNSSYETALDNQLYDMMNYNSPENDKFDINDFL